MRGRVAEPVARDPVQPGHERREPAADGGGLGRVGLARAPQGPVEERHDERVAVHVLARQVGVQHLRDGQARSVGGPVGRRLGAGDAVLVAQEARRVGARDLDDDAARDVVGHRARPRARSTAKTLANIPPLSGSDRSASPRGATSAASWSSVTVVLVSTRRCYRPGRRSRTRARAGHRRVRTP